MTISDESITLAFINFNFLSILFFIFQIMIKYDTNRRNIIHSYEAEFVRPWPLNHNFCGVVISSPNNREELRRDIEEKKEEWEKKQIQEQDKK